MVDFRALRQVQRVEFVRVRQGPDDRLWVGGTIEGSAREGARAEEIAALWRQFRPAEPARCFFPEYGVRFYLDDGTSFVAGLCFDCNNLAVAFADGREDEWGTFDAHAPAAARMLNAIEGRPIDEGVVDPPSRPPPRSVCPRCGGKGWLAPQAADAFPKPCPCRAR